MFMFCMHVCLCMCVSVCSSAAQCVSCSTAGSARPPALPARCACAHVFVSVRLCVCARETDRQDSPMGSMLSLRKADYGTCQGVRNTPHQHYTDSQLSTHLYGCDCKAQSLLLPPAIWRPGQVLPPQLDMKLDSYCPYIFKAWFTNVGCCLNENLREWREATLKICWLKSRLESFGLNWHQMNNDWINTRWALLWKEIRVGHSWT